MQNKHEMAIVRYTAEQVALMQSVSYKAMEAAHKGEITPNDTETAKIADFLLYCEPHYTSVLEVVGGGELKVGSQVKQVRGQTGDCWYDRYLMGELGVVIALGEEDVILELSCGTFENASKTEVYLYLL